MKGAEAGSRDAKAKLALVYKDLGKDDLYLHWLKEAAMSGHRDSLILLWMADDPNASEQLTLAEKICAYALTFFGTSAEVICGN
ncbi:protein of unknown function [Magnetospira sp. QH-2]|nr:protein of unknown function [Magnetospira sp. QH-2]